MGLFGKLLGEVVEAVADTVDIGVGLTKDVVKAPLRALGGDGCLVKEDEAFLEDTMAVVKDIRNRD